MKLILQFSEWLGHSKMHVCVCYRWRNIQDDKENLFRSRFQTFEGSQIIKDISLMSTKSSVFYTLHILQMFVFGTKLDLYGALYIVQNPLAVHGVFRPWPSSTSDPVILKTEREIM